MDLSEIEEFRDPIWRTSHLYSIRERGGKVIPFRPRPQQWQVLDMIFRRGLKRIVILKARQIGFSTLLGVICADQLCWNTGKQISLVDKTQEDARQKLKNITVLAYDSLHPEVHTAWDLGSPLNTVTWFFQIVGAEIRVIECDSDLDLTPVQRVARMLAKGYLYGSHFLPHDAMATMHSGKTFLTELGEVGLRNCKVVPRTNDIWIGINRLRQILPRFTFRIPACERGLEAVSNYRTVRTTSTGLAVDEPVHDWSSHAASVNRVRVNAQMCCYFLD